MMLKWVLGLSGDHCPSCVAAAGQVHPAEVWHVEPGSVRLLDGGLCRCHFEEVEGAEVGDLAAIPLRDEECRHMGEEHVRLAATGTYSRQGGFEVLAISEGEGNGWRFPAEVLRASVPLWEGVETFVDHGAWFGEGRSLRDLGGVCQSAEWGEAERGVKLRLRPWGPAGELVRQIGEAMLAEGAKPRVGFSADIGFSANGRDVKAITRVYSLDLVYDPARGGAFLRAVNQRKAGYRREDDGMLEQQGDPAVGGAAPAGAVREQLSGDVRALQVLRDVQWEQQRLASEAEAARGVRVQMCEYLLDSGLAASRLPQAMQEHVRRQFAGRVFEPAELAGEVESARKLVSALTGAGAVVGPVRVGGMFSSEDQLQAAVDDLLGAPRDSGAEGLRVHRLRGIRELYLMLTGDDDLHGGFDAERVRLATTSDFTGLVKNALNKIVVNRWEELGRAGYNWWERVVVVEHFDSLQSISGTLVGTVGTLPSVSEGAEYTELVIGDSPETASFTKYGGYVPLTLELIDRDETRKLRQYPRELAAAGLRLISKEVSEIFTDNSGIGPTLADTGALFNSTAITTAGGHANLRTTALSAAEWDTVQTQVYQKRMLVKNASGYYDAGARMAVNPRYLLVPRDLQLTAMQVLYPTLERSANIYSQNMQRGEPGDVITVPEWTDANNWAAVCDPRVAPAIYVGERFGVRPEVFVAGQELSPAVFMNDEHRLKVRHFLAVWVNDYRPLHKSNVA